METLVTSFYSDVDRSRPYYSRAAARLVRRLDALEIPHRIRELPSRGSYRANCLAKPGFILDQLHAAKRPVVWLDVDAVVHQAPVAFDRMAATDTDIGVVTMTGDPNGLQATPLFFSYSPGALRLVEAWAEAAARLAATEETAFDHEALIGVFPRVAADLKVVWLGPEYCAWPGAADEHTVIELGLSDEPTKAAVLRKMGHSEAMIAQESPGFIDGDDG